jgi:hypothetical protein|tara:strand:- start:7923 stop:8255 length:333 start_codon:yes stop_codon:yes gene_type:complete
MTKAIEKEQMCVCMRHGIEIWTTKDKAQELKQALQNITSSTFVGFEGRVINTADVIGIFFPEDMEDMVLRKNGQWKCKAGTWHEKFKECLCFKKDIGEMSQEELRRKMQG